MAEMSVAWGDEEEAGLVGMESGRSVLAGYNIGLMWEATGNVKEVLEQGCDQKETDFLHGIRQSLQSRMC